LIAESGSQPRQGLFLAVLDWQHLQRTRMAFDAPRILGDQAGETEANQQALEICMSDVPCVGRREGVLPKQNPARPVPGRAGLEARSSALERYFGFSFSAAELMQ
jgi:hypothetical protein